MRAESNLMILIALSSLYLPLGPHTQAPALSPSYFFGFKGGEGGRGKGTVEGEISKISLGLKGGGDRGGLLPSPLRSTYVRIGCKYRLFPTVPIGERFLY